MDSDEKNPQLTYHIERIKAEKNMDVWQIYIWLLSISEVPPTLCIEKY